MTSADALKYFILDCSERYSSRHYMVVLSGHGSGAVGDFLLRDENPQQFLSIPRLKEALEEVKDVLSQREIKSKIDILVFHRNEFVG